MRNLILWKKSAYCEIFPRGSSTCLRLNLWKFRESGCDINKNSSVIGTQFATPLFFVRTIFCSSPDILVYVLVGAINFLKGHTDVTLI